MKNISYKNVEIKNGFWKDRQDLNRKITVNSVYDRFFETGRINAFKCDWHEGVEHKPHVFWDSDVAKWIETVAYIIQKNPCEDLEKKAEWLIDRIEENQWNDGYFNTYYTVCEPQNRFTDRNNHELYCAGHLIEAAVAYFESTGKDRFLKLMLRYVNYIYKVFAVHKNSGYVTPGHEEIELALIRLYRCTKDEKHLELAKFFIESRGRYKEKYILDVNLYAQDLPVSKQHEAVGHAVRALYLYSAIADLAYETKDEGLLQTCEELFSDIYNKKMYITGGVGSTHLGEAFTIPYDLPNETAYAETCAAIALVLFCGRMLRLTHKSIYADTLERALYNGVISGISLDGKAFFYENPLEINLKNHNKNISTVQKERYPITLRKEVFDCSCCPPNISRLFASVGGYIYGAEEDVYYIHQFVDSEVNQGNAWIKQTTKYPKDGRVLIQTKGISKLMIRIPSWCKNFKISSNNKIVNGYALIEESLDNIEINFEMKPVLIQANSSVWENAGKVALQCGPLVYCAEGIDNGGNLANLYLDKKLEAETVFDEFFGANTLNVKGYRKITTDKLYEPFDEEYNGVNIKFIPFFSFANRGESDMKVWMLYR